MIGMALIALVILGGGRPAAAEEPNTFAEARDRANEYLDQWQKVLANVKLAPTLNDEANLPKYRQEAKALREKALVTCRLASLLRDEDSPLDEVNIVRYYLCFLIYNAENTTTRP
jgi:type VI protein secretion system component VasF